MMDKAFEALHRECEQFFRQIYVGEDRVLVPGGGNPHARLMLIGEAPGEQETLLRKPFVGKAGKNLDAFLAMMHCAREDIYITNAVQYRPTKLGKTGRLSNRPPTKEEIALWRPWMLREIALVSPEVIVTLGNVPLRAVTGAALTIGEVHGRYLPEPYFGARVFPLYHPACVIYRRNLVAVYESDVHTLAQSLSTAHNG